MIPLSCTVGFVVSRRTICVHVFVCIHVPLCMRVCVQAGMSRRSINNAERDNRMHGTAQQSITRMDTRIRYTHAVDVVHKFQTLNAYYYLAVCFICFELPDCMLSRRCCCGRCCRRRHTKQPLTSTAVCSCVHTDPNMYIRCRYYFQFFSVCFKSYTFSSDLAILHMDSTSPIRKIHF